MKIQLERNLSSGSGKLFRCQVCEGACRRDRVRTLLCRDDGAIVGDICADCLKQNTSYIQRQLSQRAVRLLDRSVDNEHSLLPSPQKKALILSELTHQPLKKPPFYYWWWKRLTILTAESRELEQARSGAANCQFRLDRSIQIDIANGAHSIADPDGKPLGKDN
jgi:hypothetical protein